MSNQNQQYESIKAEVVQFAKLVAVMAAILSTSAIIASIVSTHVGDMAGSVFSFGGIGVAMVYAIGWGVQQEDSQ